MKRKSKAKQNVRRSRGSTFFATTARLLSGYPKTMVLFVCGILGIAAWQFGPLQTGYQTAFEKGHFLLAASGFALQDILVEGREQTEPNEILAVMGIKQGDSIFKCDPREAKERLNKLPWVKSATVQRRLPETVYIRLVERQPLAIWQKSSKYYLIDEQGEVLDGLRPGSFPHLMVVTGEKAPKHTKALIELLSDFPDLKKRVKAAVFISGRRWDLILDNKVRIKMPETNAKQALEQLSGLEQKNHLTDGHIASIDIRLPDRSFLYIEEGEDDKKDNGKQT